MEDEHPFVGGEHIVGIVQEYANWWFGMSVDGTRSGYFPAQCVALVQEPESEFESNSEAGPYVTVIEEPTRRRNSS